jgi:hypothetical protein
MALTVEIETIDERPVCCEYTSGRMFYGSKNSVYFSQVMEGESIDKLNRCYQQNDPTAEQLSDLVDTDGGTVQIDDAVRIVQIVKFRNGVLVYSTNGVWYLSGPDTGFTATNYSLDKISNSGCLSAESVVAVEDTHYYWSVDGIIAIRTNKYGQAIAANVIEQTSQSYYNSINADSKKKVKGNYNRLKKQVEWFYATTAQDGTTD